MDDLISRSALKEDLQNQFEAVFTAAGRNVKPEDYFIDRHATWFADSQKAEQDSFFAYLDTRPTVDAQPVVHGHWDGVTTSAYIGVDEYGEPKYAERRFFTHKKCGRRSAVREKFCPNCGAKMDGGARDG